MHRKLIPETSKFLSKRLFNRRTPFIFALRSQCLPFSSLPYQRSSVANLQVSTPLSTSNTYFKHEDIDIKGLKVGISTFNHDLSWYHFSNLKQDFKLHLLDAELLSELLRNTKFPDYGRANPRLVTEKFNILLETFDNLEFELNENDLRHLVATYSALGMPNEAQRSWKKMTKVISNPSIYSYAALAYSHLMAEKPSLVVDLHLKLLEKGIRPDRYFLILVMEAYGKLGLGDLVLKTFKELSSIGVTPVGRNTYYKLFRSLHDCSEGYIKSITPLFDTLISTGCKPNESIFRTIISYHLKFKYFDEAIVWFKAMATYSIQPNMGKYVYFMFAYEPTNFPEVFIDNLTDSQYEEFYRAVSYRIKMMPFTSTNPRPYQLLDRIANARSKN